MCKQDIAVGLPVDDWRPAANALLCDTPSVRSADVLANVETVLLKISAEALKRLFREAPALAAPFLLGLSKTISSRVRTLTKRYEDSILFARTAGEK